MLKEVIWMEACCSKTFQHYQCLCRCVSYPGHGHWHILMPSQMLTFKLALMTIWMVFSLFSPNGKCSLARPHHTFSLYISLSQICICPEMSAAFWGILLFAIGFCSTWQSPIWHLQMQQRTVFTYRSLYSLYNLVRFKCSISRGTEIHRHSVLFSALPLMWGDLFKFSECFHNIMDCRLKIP